MTLGGVRLRLEARRATHRPSVGLTLDGVLADELASVTGPVVLKHYSGTRRWFGKPGCDDDLACAADGASFPCVTSCACRCDDVVCDCAFDGLEAAMQVDALAAAERISRGAPATRKAELDQAPERVRLHWVFKRSLGGSGNCAVVGELDVSPATWAAFFGRAVHAAAVINARVGYRLIDVLSPMNEANHPLQDGAHHNAAGQPMLGGFISFVDLIRQASCGAQGCCAPDRYIVPAPDVPALLAAAMAAAHDALSTIDPAIAPRVALSLYLDTEQRDPLQLVDGVAPSIVTPVGPFMRTFGAALAGRAFPDALVVVDTYPGSWGAPWFETDDGIVHHVDPTTRHVRRVDPVAAADAAIARTLAARDDIAAVTGTAPDMLLGEVGWSTFDGDEAAQVAFVERLFDGMAATPEIEGFIWFKSNDRATFEFPTWDTAPNPLGGDDVACDAPLLGPILCAADVLAKMEGQWGLRRVDGTAKPAWGAFLRRWSLR